MASYSGTSSRLLVEVSGDERRRASVILGESPSVTVLPGDEPRSASDLPDAAFFVVERGTALMAGGSPDSRRLVVAVAGPGALLVPPCEAEHVTALVPTRLTAVSPDAHEALLALPSAASAIASALIDAVSDREESLANFARFPYVERVRAKLLQLARRHGRVERAGVVIDLPLTHELLAEMVGSTRETVTLALRELASEGFVSRENRLYRLSALPDELAAAARSA